MLSRARQIALIATACAAFWLHAPAAGPPGPDLTRPAARADAGETPAVPAPQGMTEIRALFEDYARFHAEKKLDAWQNLFLAEANCISTAADGSVTIRHADVMARAIEEEARSIKTQKISFEDTRIEVHGNAALFAANWTLLHDGKVARRGRAFFSLVKKDGAWRIAALVWHRD